MPALLSVLVLASQVQLSFAFDGCAALTPASKAAVQAVAQALYDPRLANSRFFVEGHASRTGDRAAELAVSERLANEVLDQLVLLGVPREHLVARGYGATHPAIADLPEDYENCRVELVKA